MTLRQGIRDLIIGRHKHIASRGEFKQVMLSGQFAVIGIVLLMFYGTIDVFTESYATLPIFALNSVLLAGSIYIHRLGKHCLANYFLLPTLNLTVYILSSSESPNTGAFIFFLPVSLAAFAVFSYNQRLLSILFAVFTYTLFILAYFVDFSLLPMRDYTADMQLLYMVINFSIALPASLMAIYLLISLNHDGALNLIQSNKLLVKTNEELDRFVYSTSHDLRAPLTSIMGLIDISNRSGDIVEMRRYMGMMREQVNNLDKFIKDITDYSRNNRMEIAREKVKLCALAGEVWESLKYAREARDITFQLNIPEHVEIESDKNRLKIVLSNLIANAIRYHDYRKDDKFIRIHCKVNGKGVYLHVEDNGQGIRPEYQPKVFDMFYRANEKSKGSGLGLYIVKETLTRLSGSIYVESSPGVGSIFTVKLPY